MPEKQAKEAVKVNPIHYIIADGLDDGANLFNFLPEFKLEKYVQKHWTATLWPTINPQEFRVFRQSIENLSEKVENYALSLLFKLDEKEINKTFKKRNILEYMPIKAGVLEDFIQEAIRQNRWYNGLITATFDLQRGTNFYKAELSQIEDSGEIILHASRIKPREVDIDYLIHISKRTPYSHEDGWEEESGEDSKEGPQ